MTRVVIVANWDWVLHQLSLPVARALKEAGYDVTLASPPGHYVEALTREGFDWTEWTLERRSFNPFREISAIARLARLYRRLRPDVVHHFTIKPALYGSVAAKLTRTTKVINSFTGLGYLFSEHSRARKLLATVRPILRVALRNTYVVFENDFDRTTFISRRLASPERSQVIPGSVDTDRFRPPTGARNNAHPVVLMAGRLLYDKGVAEFVEAAGRLRERGVKARFWVAGDPDDGNPSSVPPQVVDAWGREGAVEFLGHRSDMPELLRQADVAVLPSRHEGSPRFLLEAAATGLPLVTTDIPGCREIVRDGTSGLVVQPGDPVALAGAIEELLGDRARRARLGASGREMAVAEFGEEVIAKRYADLYAGVAAAK